VIETLFRIAVAVVVAYGIIRLGMFMLGNLSRPIPEPPPAGELRRVKIHYRCSMCGTELFIRTAPDEDPPPPRHCLEDMDLVAPID